MYQDYVIKDGKFIGQFEEMYQKFNDPWEQSTREKNSYEKLIGLELLKKNNHSNVVELGCGLGNYTNSIRSVVNNCLGVDISETAIKKAKENFPECKFLVSDVDNINLYEKVDCIMMVEITWYILNKLENFKNIISKFKGVGVYHSLNTYPKDVQKYGKEYFTNNLEIIEYFSDIIEIEEYGEFYQEKNNGCIRTYFYGKIK
jgi:ubiquinone/menaquinone biosynthesis C-methylase UbiE